jgi:hypothetical protein
MPPGRLAAQPVAGAYIVMRDVGVRLFRPVDRGGLLSEVLVPPPFMASVCPGGCERREGIGWNCDDLSARACDHVAATRSDVDGAFTDDHVRHAPTIANRLPRKGVIRELGDHPSRGEEVPGLP